MKSHILVAEDDLALQDLFTRVLKTNGYDVKVANNGDEVLRSIEESVPDILLLDLGLPGAHGTEILRQLRQRPDHKRIHIIVITGNHFMENSLEMDAIDLFLLKPVGVGELLQMVNRFAKAPTPIPINVADSSPNQQLCL